MAYTEYPEKVEELGKLINTERTARGLKPLYCVPHLNECAMIRASEVSVYWSHTRPDGRNWSSVIDLDIVDLAHYSENLAAGSESAESTLNQWRNSQNHWNAIINEYYTHIGIGVIYNPNGVNGVKWFWCTIFTSDFRGNNYEYEGQYLPGEYSGGTTEISCIDTETGRNITEISINIYSRDTEKRDLSGVRVAQNDSDVDHEISSDKSNIWFATGSYPSTVSKIPTGTYYVEIRNAPNGYYSDFLNTSSYYYTYFTIETDGTSDKDNITLNLTPRKLTVLKVESETGNALSGAILELSGNYDLSETDVSQDFTLSDDKRTITFTSGNSPVVFTRIPSGIYTLSEYSAPEDYIKAERAVFSIDKSDISLSDGNKSGFIENNILKIPAKKRIVNFFPIAYENSIRVYDISEPQTGFTSNGLAVLRPTSCTSTKNADVWDIELVHPIDEWGKYRYLLPENVLKVNGQLFRIDIMTSEYSEQGGLIIVHARHISGDMAEQSLIENAEFEGGTAQDFIDFAVEKSKIQDGVDDEFYPQYEFAITTDITTRAEGDEYVNVTLLGALIGVDNCFLNRYGGEVYRDNFRMSINEKMENARENAFCLRYGAGVSGIKQKIDYTNFATLLAVFDNFGNSWAVSYDGNSRGFFHHPHRKNARFNYSNENMERLISDGYKLWSTIDAPKTTYEVQVNQLSDDPRYSGFRNLLDCDYGDSGTIYCPELDIDTVQKVTEVVRNELTGEIINMKLGNVVSSLVRPNFMGDTVSSGHAVWDKLNRRNK